MSAAPVVSSPLAPEVDIASVVTGPLVTGSLVIGPLVPASPLVLPSTAPVVDPPASAAVAPVSGSALVVITVAPALELALSSARSCPT